MPSRSRRVRCRRFVPFRRVLVEHLESRCLLAVLPPLQAVEPLGSLVYEGSVSSSLVSGSTDSYTLDVDPGQTISVVAASHGPDFTLNYEASQETDLVWNDLIGTPHEDGTSNQFDFDLNGVATLIPPVTATTITGAYEFTGVGGVEVPSLQRLPDVGEPPTRESASFEIWFKPDADSDTDVLFETGANGDGMSFTYDGNTDTLTFKIKDSGTQLAINANGFSKTEFSQVVGVYARDTDADATDVMTLYLNGLPVSSATATTLDDWAGGNSSGLATMAGGGAFNINYDDLSPFTPFEGEIAIFRFAESPLSPEEVLGRFNNVALGGPSETNLELYRLTDDGSVLVASALVADGEQTIIQPVATRGRIGAKVPGPETYELVLSRDANAMGGEYDASVILNAAVEEEMYGGSSNETLAGAQDLEPSFLQLLRSVSADNAGRQPARAAVLGSTGSPSDNGDQSDSGRDVYCFQLTAGETATLAATSLTPGGISLQLKDATGTVVAEADAVGTNADEIISDYVAAETGEYYAVVTGNGADYSLIVTRNADFDLGGNDGPFSSQKVVSAQVAGRQWLAGHLGLPSSVVDEVVPNNSMAEAQNIDDESWSLEFSPDIGDWDSNTSEILPHVTIVGTGDGSHDWYSFTVPNADARGIFDIDYTYRFDSELYLYRGDGTYIGMRHGSFLSEGQGGSTSRDDALIEYTFPDAGVYLLEVTGYWGAPISTQAEYQLQVSIENHPLGPSASDYYEVQLTEGKPLQVETSLPAAGGGEFENTLDPAVFVYDAEGSLVAEDDNSAQDGRNARLKYNVPKGAAGTYFVQVVASDATPSATSGEYILSIKGNVLGQPSVPQGPPLRGAGSPVRDVILESVLDESLGFAQGPTLDGALSDSQEALTAPASSQATDGQNGAKLRDELFATIGSDDTEVIFTDEGLLEPAL